MRTLKLTSVFLALSLSTFGIVAPLCGDDTESLTATADGKSVTLNFGAVELAAMEERPELLLVALSKSNVECCEPREQISRCVWACCDGATRIRTCGSRLMRVLKSLQGTKNGGSK
jgi:hypothetical protein